MDQYSSKLLETAVREFSSLPGIGKRSALRLALWILKCPESQVDGFASAIMDLRTKIQYCKSCHTLSDQEICEICSSSRRNRSQICVVSDVRDVMAIENTGYFSGLYHVLGGVISPIDGVSPNDLSIESLISRVKEQPVEEVILALPATMEGDTTNFYIHKKLKDINIIISTIARGISVGEELEYTDEITLGRSIQNRTLLA